MERIRLLDILRGLAIIGTLGTNIWIFATLGEFDFIASGIRWWESTELAVSTLFVTLTNGKFLGMLTILFGIGLELKRQKNERSGKKWLGLYIWSSILLLLDGFIHFLLVFEYDILMSYAVTAIIVAWLLQRGVKWTKRIGVLMAVLHVLGVILLSISFAYIMEEPEFMHELQDTLAVSADIYMNGTYFEQVAYRFQDFWELRGEAIGVIPMNICLFLLGVWFVRSGLFASDARGQQLRRRLLVWGLGIGVPLNALTLLPIGYFDIAVRYLFAPILSLGYIGMIALLLEEGRCVFVFKRFEEIGRMALSCYILQNIVASILFYGWGMGLGQYNSTWLALAGWVLISLFMMIFAHYWLSYFRRGPVEYVWRQLANWPIRRKKKIELGV